MYRGCQNPKFLFKLERFWWGKRHKQEEWQWLWKDLNEMRREIAVELASTFLVLEWDLVHKTSCLLSFFWWVAEWGYWAHKSTARRHEASVGRKSKLKEVCILSGFHLWAKWPWDIKLNGENGSCSWSSDLWPSSWQEPDPYDCNVRGGAVKEPKGLFTTLSSGWKAACTTWSRLYTEPFSSK